MCKSSIALICLTLSIVTALTDYCSICGPGRQHIACEMGDDTWGSSCPGDRYVVDLNEDEVALFVDRHNFYRNKIALGKESGFSPSSLMATMIWDEELAYLAELNIKNCEQKHDECRATENFKRAGQNLHTIAFASDFQDVKTTIEKTVMDWYSEHKDASQETIEAYGPPQSRKVVTHFAQLIQGKNVAVGCGIVRFTRGGMKTELIACNYAVSNLINKKVYKEGPPASECTTGVNEQYPGLCSEKEPIDPNVIQK